MLQVKVVSIGTSPRANVLATATVELFDADCRITIADVRVLENRTGQRWVALPSFAISKGQRNYQYFPTLEITPKELVRELGEKVLAEFERQADGAK